MIRTMMRTVKGVFVAALAWLIVSGPSLAAACSVCTAGRDEENQTAFLLSTLFMSLLPLIAIGTLVYVLWRRVQKLEAETLASSQTATLPVIVPVTVPVATSLGSAGS
jgi:hypothetical protein